MFCFVLFWFVSVCVCVWESDNWTKNILTLLLQLRKYAVAFIASEFYVVLFSFSHLFATYAMNHSKQANTFFYLPNKISWHILHRIFCCFFFIQNFKCEQAASCLLQCNAIFRRRRKKKLCGSSRFRSSAAKLVNRTGSKSICMHMKWIKTIIAYQRSNCILKLCQRQQKALNQWYE